MTSLLLLKIITVPLLFKYFSLFVYFEGNMDNKNFEIITGFKTIFKGLKKKK